MPTTHSEGTRYTSVLLRLRLDHYERLLVLADQEDVKPTAIIREAISDFLETRDAHDKALPGRVTP